MDFGINGLLPGTNYVVKLSNGKYFTLGSPGNTDNLAYAQKYSFEWQIVKDHYLHIYVSHHNLTYDVIKVRLKYEIIE